MRALPRGADAKPSKPAEQKKIAVAKADAEYAIAKEQCDDRKGKEKAIARALPRLLTSRR